MKQIRIASSIGVGDTNKGHLTLGDFSKGHRTETPHRIEWGENSSYLVGKNVAQFARPLESLDFQRFSDGLGMRALTYTSLGLLLGDGEHTVSIMAGLPVEVLEDDELGQKTKRGLRNWLEGDHQFSIDGVRTQLHVSRVSIMPQPAGTFFAWGLNNQGNWAKGSDAFNSTVAICDVGFNTLDVFTLQGGKIMERFTGGDTAGMRRAIELLLRALENQYKVKYSLHEADALIRAEDATISISGGKVDLTDIISDAKKAAGAGIITFLDERWGNGRQFENLIFTGGGAAALKDILIEQYPLGYMMPDPVTANALGLARYGRRVFDTKMVIGLDPGFGGFKVVQL
ncbi:MAG: ParM/StbA family protein [Chloroflexota bacterium]|nr:ParM/StbA family protein [Chloroflexota bacterium]